MIVFSRPVVIRVTTGAGIGIGRTWPGYGLAVAGMTVVTTQITSMITRVVAGYMAVVGHRQPAVGGMTIVALYSRHEMTVGLTRRGGAVMAGVAVAGHPGVIEGHGGPGGG